MALKGKMLCEECNKYFLNERALVQHNLKMHPIAEEKRVEKVRFTSPKAPFLRVYVSPTTWGVIETPTGSVRTQVEGITAEFNKGVLETDNPIIIDYLENKYNDERIPVFSQKKLRELANVKSV